MSRVEIYRERYVDDPSLTVKVGKWRWRYRATNGRILADSGQAYVRRIDALNGCATVLGGEVEQTHIDNPERQWIRRTIHNDWAVPLAAPEHEAIPVVDLTRDAS